jgi:hypothetical protein
MMEHYRETVLTLPYHLGDRRQWARLAESGKAELGNGLRLADILADVSLY